MVMQNNGAAFTAWDTTSFEFLFPFFFSSRRRHTRLVSDWSPDVCSSDLLVSVWTEQEVSDTDTFVATVGPLAADPAVQEALTNRITTTVFEYVDVQALANQAIDALRSEERRVGKECRSRWWADE